MLQAPTGLIDDSQVSFGVAPSLLAFVVGLRTYLDTVVLTGFICCGLARLARFNATVALVPKDTGGKAKYFEGLPIPSSLILVGVLSYWARNGWIEGQQGIPWGTITLWGQPGGRGELHVVSIVFGLWAAAMTHSVTLPFQMVVKTQDVQRLFLQAVLSRGMLSGELAQLLWKKCIHAVKAVDGQLDVPQRTDKAAWDAFITTINKSLNDLELEFRHLTDEESGKEMYAIVNRKGDEIAQMATEYNASEIAYFKATVEQIMLAPREAYSVSSFAALREVSAIKPKVNLSKTQAEVVLNSFVANGWLRKSKRGRFSLSTRALLELHPYLKSTYPDEVIECTICMEIITRGVACHTNNCKTRMHSHCFAIYRRHNQSCPTCSVAWPQEATMSPLVPVGEGAAKDEDDKRRVRRRNQTTSEDAEDEVDEEVDEDLDQTQAGSSTQPSIQKRSKQMRKREEADMDIDNEEVATQPRSTQRSRRSTRR
ncbi:hypothetical protein AX16_003723 [Volvariella volvacea WC 439]|nr:hypothetical protein AX16_003723 [Volvariella volvacea WC 439]